MISSTYLTTRIERSIRKYCKSTIWASLELKINDLQLSLMSLNFSYHVEMSNAVKQKTSRGRDGVLYIKKRTYHVCFARNCLKFSIRIGYYKRNLWTTASEIYFSANLRKRLLFNFGIGSYHIETSPLICSPNQWTGFYMIGFSVMKEFALWFSNLVTHFMPLVSSHNPWKRQQKDA